MPDDQMYAAPSTVFDAAAHLVHAARLLDAACTRDGLSNVQLAKLLKVGRDAVSKQRKGTQWLDIPSLLALASLVKVPQRTSSRMTPRPPSVNWCRPSPR